MKFRGRGTCYKDKPAIVGAVSRRNKRVRIMVKRTLSKKEAQSDVEGCTQGFVAVNTDDFTIYAGMDTLSRVVKHEVVDHKNREFARGSVHTNTVEGLWSIVRHKLNTFRGVSKENLELYVGVIEFLKNSYTRGELSILRLVCSFLTVAKRATLFST